jgi:hypothetical protein
MKTLSIVDGWQDFAASVIPLTAPPAQYTDMRVAFYAGAILILDATIAIGDSDASEAARIEMLDRLHVERRAFLQEMKLRNRDTK